jgi:hypothetical protein
MVEAEPPVPIALLVADEVYQEAGTGKWIIAGAFSTINCRAMPAQHPRLNIFFQMTNISQPVEVRLKIEHETQEEVLLNLKGQMRAGSPLEVISQSVQINNLQFKRDGKYWVQLISHDQILSQAPLWVRLIKPEEDEYKDVPPVMP